MDKYIKTLKLSCFLLMLLIALGFKTIYSSKVSDLALYTAKGDSVLYCLFAPPENNLSYRIKFNNSTKYQYGSAFKGNRIASTLKKNFLDPKCTSARVVVFGDTFVVFLVTRSTTLNKKWYSIKLEDEPTIRIPEEGFNKFLDSKYPEEYADVHFKISVSNLMWLARLSEISATDAKHVLELLQDRPNTASIRLPIFDFNVNLMLAIVVLAILIVGEVFTLYFCALRLSEQDSPSDEFFLFSETTSRLSISDRFALRLMKLSYFVSLIALIWSAPYVLFRFAEIAYSMPKSTIYQSPSNHLIAAGLCFMLLLLSIPAILGPWHLTMLFLRKTRKLSG